MMKLVQLIMKRPSNTQIRGIKAGTGLALILIWVVAFYVNNLELNETIFGLGLDENNKFIAEHLIIALWFPLLILWGLDISLLSRGRTRILQIVFWVFLMIVWGMFQNYPTLTVDVFYPIIWFFAIIAGISGKLITTKGLKYWQKVTKIRV